LNRFEIVVWVLAVSRLGHDLSTDQHHRKRSSRSRRATFAPFQRFRDSRSVWRGCDRCDSQPMPAHVSITGQWHATAAPPGKRSNPK